MGQDIFDSSDWYRATPLSERTAAWRAAKAGDAEIRYDEERGSKRLRRWREQAKFKDDRFFLARLEEEGLTEELLRRLLGENPDSIKSRLGEPPLWLVEWISAFSDASTKETTTDAITKDLWRENPGLAFLTAITPLIRRGFDRLRAGVNTLIADSAVAQSELPFEPATIENLLLGRLPVELARLMSRTMALELNVARLSEELNGNAA